MTVPVTRHPNIGDSLDDKNSISLTLFNTILEIVRIHVELHNYWEVISRDIKVREQWEVRQRIPRNKPPH